MLPKNILLAGSFEVTQYVDLQAINNTSYSWWVQAWLMSASYNYWVQAIVDELQAIVEELQAIGEECKL
jgi:hypothetical protein